MKFKTASEFIHALEVEGKMFERPRGDNKHEFLAWSNGGVWRFVDGDAWGYFSTTHIDLTHDWQEYEPEKH